MGRRILACTLAFLLAGISLPAQDSAIAVITQSTSAHLNTAAASAGTNIYDGDRLGTEDKGTLSLRTGPVQVNLLANSVLVMNRGTSGLNPRLERGTVVFSTIGAEQLEVRAADVRVRPQSPVPTVGQLTLGDCDLVVTSRTASLEVIAGNETKIVEEGKSYRVFLDRPCASSNARRPPIMAGHSRFLQITLIAVGTATVIAVDEALESPDRP